MNLVRSGHAPRLWGPARTFEMAALREALGLGRAVERDEESTRSSRRTLRSKAPLFAGRDRERAGKRLPHGLAARAGERRIRKPRSAASESRGARGGSSNAHVSGVTCSPSDFWLDGPRVERSVADFRAARFARQAMVRPKRRLAIISAFCLGSVVLAVGAMLVYCTAMPGRSKAGPLTALSVDERAVSGELRRHVEALSVDIGERRATRGDSLLRAERYLMAELSLVGAGTLRREIVPGSPTEAANLVLDLPGKEGAPLVLVGAHYDSAPGGTPAANDNASGTAAALVLARRLARSEHRLPLRFVLFANEEMPFFQTNAMGSLVHARGCRERGEELRAMFSLETMGHFSDAPGTQKYPPPLSRLYPDTGNFIGFVGNLASRALVRESLGHFRAHATVPSEGAALPASLPGVGWSDHWAFWHVGYRAVMVTDTALFRDPNYHQLTDTPDQMDFDRLARVVVGLEAMLKELSAN